MIIKKLNETDLICLDLSNSTPYKQKKSLIDLISSNGGRISFVLNKNVKFLIKDDKANLDTYKCRTAFKLGIPVFHISYLFDYLLSDVNKSSVKLNDYLIFNKQKEKNFKNGLISLDVKKTTSSVKKEVDLNKLTFYEPKEDIYMNEFEAKGCNVLKWAVFHVINTC